MEPAINLRVDEQPARLKESFEGGGVLHEKKVYLFGQAEPQLVHYQGDYKLINVPAIIAIDLPFPSSDKMGIASVQREEEIIPMEQMDIDWVPYGLRSQVVILTCTQTTLALSHMHGNYGVRAEHLSWLIRRFKIRVQDETRNC